MIQIRYNFQLIILIYYIYFNTIYDNMQYKFLSTRELIKRK